MQIAQNLRVFENWPNAYEILSIEKNLLDFVKLTECLPNL